MRRRGRGGQRPVPIAWVVPGLVITLLVHYIAVAAGAWYAFTDWNGLAANPKFIGLSNFREILHDPSARAALWNTLELAFAFVAAVNVVGLALAVALNRSLKTRNYLRALFFAPVVMSAVAVSFVWQYIFQYDGPLNQVLRWVGLGSWARPWLGDPQFALWTIWVVFVWQFAGLAMVMYLAGLQGIPDELDEASAVDGASGWYRFRRVTLPLLAPAMTVAITFHLIVGLRAFDQIIAMTNGGPVAASETLSTQVYKQTFVYGRFGYGAAFALVLTLVITVVALLQLVVLRRRERRI
jgi:raffinose/stachyose/melibiose transport system permease protein